MTPCRWNRRRRVKVCEYLKNGEYDYEIDLGYALRTCPFGGMRETRDHQYQSNQDAEEGGHLHVINSEAGERRTGRSRLRAHRRRRPHARVLGDLSRRQAAEPRRRKGERGLPQRLGDLVRTVPLRDAGIAGI